MGLFSKKRSNASEPRKSLEDIVWRPERVVAPIDHEMGWEYLYFAAELARGLSDNKGAFDEMMSTTLAGGAQVSAQPFEEIQQMMEELSSTVGFIEEIFSPANMVKGFGEPGVQGNETSISHLSCEIVGVYAELIAISRLLKSRNYGAFQAVAGEVASMSYTPLKEIRDFSDLASTSFQKAMGEVRQGITPKEPLTLTLKITMDDEVVERLSRSLNQLRG